MLALLRKLTELKASYESALIAKARTESLDELRFLAGQIAAMREIIRLVDQQLNQEKPDGE